MLNWSLFNTDSRGIYDTSNNKTWRDLVHHIKNETGYNASINNQYIQLLLQKYAIGIKVSSSNKYDLDDKIPIDLEEIQLISKEIQDNIAVCRELCEIDRNTILDLRKYKTLEIEIGYYKRNETIPSNSIYGHWDNVFKEIIVKIIREYGDCYIVKLPEPLQVNFMMGPTIKSLYVGLDKEKNIVYPIRLKSPTMENDILEYNGKYPFECECPGNTNTWKLINDLNNQLVVHTVVYI